MSKLNIVLEGGGALGSAFIGSLQAIEDAGFEPNMVVGASAGAITAALINIGYDSTELKEAITEVKNDLPIFTTFLGERNFLSLFYHLESTGGIFDDDDFLEWFADRLQQKSLDPDITLSQLHTHTGKLLTIIASNITKKEMLVLNANTAPDLPVLWAVRMSMSIPFVWDVVTWQPDWGLYKGGFLVTDEIVDGGVCSNFALWLFKESNTYIQVQEDLPCIGLLLDENKSLNGVSDIPKNPTSFKIVNRAMEIFDTARISKDWEYINTFSDEIAFLPCKGYGVLEFDLAGDKLHALINAAYEATKKVLHR
jgi:predicted acylesterase/phospholipase RssA